MHKNHEIDEERKQIDRMGKYMIFMFAAPLVVSPIVALFSVEYAIQAGFGASFLFLLLFLYEAVFPVGNN